jgi:anthranilate synthase/aminodeoxychorismate synthase-like glutamine amidotransferase
MGKRIAVIDNYDSFTYNLVQYLEMLGAHCDVFLNDGIEAASLLEKSPDGVLLSPGPGTPDDAGVTLSAIQVLGGKIPILGVCLGHQAIGQAYGAKVVRADRLMHGKTSPILHEGHGVFHGLPSPFTATRYHSLVIAPETVPPELEITARTAEGEIMGVKHRTLAVEGVQFHPESILTDQGVELVHNWLRSL